MVDAMTVMGSEYRLVGKRGIMKVGYREGKLGSEGQTDFIRQKRRPVWAKAG